MWIDTGETKHIFNALKYTLSLSVTGLALLHGLFPSQTYLSPLWYSSLLLVQFDSPSC